MHPLDFEFLKDRYDFELERKDKLTDSLNLPVGVLGGLGSLLALMARSFTYRDSVLTWMFVPFLVLAVVTFFTCLVQLSRAYHRQKYMYLPLLQDLESAEEDFREFANYVESSGGTLIEDYDKEFRHSIMRAADRNTKNNDERSNLLYWARAWLFGVLALTALAGIPFVTDQVRFFMPRAEAPQQPAPTQPAPQNTTPQPPQFPPNREIREGDRAPKR